VKYGKSFLPVNFPFDDWWVGAGLGITVAEIERLTPKLAPASGAYQRKIDRGNPLTIATNILQLYYGLVYPVCNSVHLERRMAMHTMTRTSTTEMEVTSIRLERELKEKLKELSGNQGYQALIRDVLWDYVHQKSGEYTPPISPSDICATVAATAYQEERCTLTGNPIRANEAMILGLTKNGGMVPLRLDSLQNF
jgi:hypothetical protein